jgi:hypothetical protein
MSFSVRRALVRLGISMAIAFAFGWLISEVTYFLVSDFNRSTPEIIELIIPAGTASRLAAGQQTLSLPEKMTFLQGDTLEVKNEDNVPHQLGPIWVPPGTSGKLKLGEPNLYSYSCSFEPGKYLGLDVRSGVDAFTQIEGIVSIALPTGMLLWLYSLVAKPLDSNGIKKV